MRKILLSVLIALAAVVIVPKVANAYEVRVDGSWLTQPCFGCPGDQALADLKAQQVDADAAEAALEESRTPENLQAALAVDLFSYDKAGHALELGDIATASGDTAKAKDWYRQAVAFGTAAEAIPLNEKFVNRKDENVPKKSHKLGAKWKRLAAAKLAKLGG